VRSSSAPLLNRRGARRGSSARLPCSSPVAFGKRRAWQLATPAERGRCFALKAIAP
jgi:hypothetical protein